MIRRKRPKLDYNQRQFCRWARRVKQAAQRRQWDIMQNANVMRNYYRWMMELDR